MSAVPKSIGNRSKVSGEVKGRNKNSRKGLTSFSQNHSSWPHRIRHRLHSLLCPNLEIELCFQVSTFFDALACSSDKATSFAPRGLISSS